MFADSIDENQRVEIYDSMTVQAFDGVSVTLFSVAEKLGGCMGWVKESNLKIDSKPLSNTPLLALSGWC